MRNRGDLVGVRVEKDSQKDIKAKMATNETSLTNKQNVGGNTQDSLDIAKEQLEIAKETQKDKFANLLKSHPVIKKFIKLREMLTTVLPMLKGGLKIFAMGFIYVMIGVLGLILLVKAFGPAIKKAWENMKPFIMMGINLIWVGISTVMDGVGLIFSALFGKGSFMDAIDGFILIAMGLLEIVLGVVWVLVLGGLGLLLNLWIETFKDWMDRTQVWAEKLQEEGYKAMLVVAAKIVAVIVIVALILAWIPTVPIWLAIIITIAVAKLVLGIGDHVKNALNKANPLNWFGGGKAEGGQTDGRMNLVGEKGPELVTLPAGSMVHSNSDSKKMLNSGGNTQNVTNNFNINIDAKDTSNAELKRVADIVSKQIGNKINRMTTSGTFV